MNVTMQTVIDKRIGQRVHDLRKQAGWSLRRLAKESGVSASNILRIEAGLVVPGSDTLALIAKGLNVSVAQLTGDEPLGELPPDVLQFAHEVSLLDADERRDILNWARGFMRVQQTETQQFLLLGDKRDMMGDKPEGE